jgi:hypothetical protein
MKHHIIFIIVIISITILGSCRDKISDSKTYTIKGKLLKNCGGEVIANTELKIISKSQVFTQGFSAIATTDANGNFVFSYDRNGGTDISLHVTSGKIFLEEIPNNTDIDLGIIYYTPTCNFVFKVVVDSAYTNLDTFLISNFNYDSPQPRPYIHKIAGPFKDTILPPVYNFSQLQTIYYFDLGKIIVNTDYEIWKGPILSNAGIKVKSGHAEQEPYLNQCNVMDTFLIRIN